MRKTLFTKLLFSYFLLVTISYAVLGLSLSVLFSHYYFSLREKELLKRGEDLLALLTQHTDSNFEIPEVARRLTQGIFINLKSKEDFLREYPMPPRNFMQRMWRLRANPNFSQKLWETIQKGKHASWKNFHPVLRQDVLSVAIPVRKNKDVVAALILATPLANIQTTVRTVEYFILFSGIISLSFSLLLAFWFSSSLTHPLRKMSEIARQLTQGNFQEKITIHTQDEVGQLARDFNILSENLRETIGKLREEKERTENIFLHMSEGIVAINGKKQIVSLNPALQKTLSLQNQEIHSLHDLHLGEEIEKTFSEVLSSGEEREKEFELSNGKNVIFHITPLKENQMVKGAVAVIQDITELRKVDKLRMEFIANVSHELRTPLTSIQGFLEAAIDEIISFPEWKDQYLPLLHKETLRLSRLIHDLLDLSLMESGKIQWEMTNVFIPGLIQRVITKLAPLCKERDITIQEEFTTSFPEVWGNEDRLEQVFTNLIHNALLFSPSGSLVIVGGKREAHEALLFVRDQGSGIPPQDLPHIFERFYRVEKSRSRQGGGTGLGLAITKQIIEHHGGKIWVESQMGQGTTFLFTLPLYPLSSYSNLPQDSLQEKC